MRYLNRFRLSSRLKRAKTASSGGGSSGPNLPANQLAMFNKLKELNPYMLYACGDWGGTAGDTLKDWGSAGFDLTVNESNNLPTVVTQGSFKGIRSPESSSSGKGFKRSGVSILANESSAGLGSIKDRTIIALVYSEPANASPRSIVGFRNPASLTGAVFLNNQNSNSALTFYNGSTFQNFGTLSSSLVNNGRWYMVAHRLGPEPGFQYSNDNRINGSAAVSNSNTSVLAANNNRTDFYLLTMPGFAQFYGVVANVAIFDRVLTNAEIDQIYSSIGINLSA